MSEFVLRSSLLFLRSFLSRQFPFLNGSALRAVGTSGVLFCNNTRRRSSFPSSPLYNLRRSETNDDDEDDDDGTPRPSRQCFASFGNGGSLPERDQGMLRSFCWRWDAAKGYLPAGSCHTPGCQLGHGGHSLASITVCLPHSLFLSSPQIREDAVLNDYTSPLPHTYLGAETLPDSFNWGDVNGVSYLTHSLNQHIPQYCGSCWAHGAVSALADRIKIARLGQGDDINLSIQYILNCGDAGSCHGGYHVTTYEFIKKVGYIPYDTCNPYMACSSESTDGFCPHLDTTCTAQNTCKTCDTFAGMGGSCSEIDYFPNATVVEYGMIDLDDSVVENIMTELCKYQLNSTVCAKSSSIPIVILTSLLFFSFAPLQMFVVQWQPPLTLSLLLHTVAASSLMTRTARAPTTLCRLLVGARMLRAAKSTGLSATRGDNTGVKWATCALKLAKTCWALKAKLLGRHRGRSPCITFRAARMERTASLTSRTNPSVLRFTRILPPIWRL